MIQVVKMHDLRGARGLNGIVDESRENVLRKFGISGKAERMYFRGV